MTNGYYAPSPPRARGNSSREAKLSTFSGDDSQSWEDYEAHFRLVSRANGWDKDTAVSNLLTRLTGAAMTHWRTLPEYIQEDCDAFLEAMRQRFSTLKSLQTVRKRLEDRRQKPGETLEALAADIRMMVGLLHPYESQAQREKEGVHHFMRAISSPAIVQAIVQTRTATDGVLSLQRALAVATDTQEMHEAYLPKSYKAAVRMAAAGQMESIPPEYMDTLSATDEAHVFAAYMEGQGKAAGASATTPKCWICDSTDHLSLKCPHRLNGCASGWGKLMAQLREKFSFDRDPPHFLFQQLSLRSKDGGGKGGKPGGRGGGGKGKGKGQKGDGRGAAQKGESTSGGEASTQPTPATTPSNPTTPKGPDKGATPKDGADSSNQGNC